MRGGISRREPPISGTALVAHPCPAQARAKAILKRQIRRNRATVCFGPHFVGDLILCGDNLKRPNAIFIPYRTQQPDTCSRETLDSSKMDLHARGVPVQIWAQTEDSELNAHERPPAVAQRRSREVLLAPP